MHRGRILAVIASLLCSLALTEAIGTARAGPVEPVTGAWEGKTAQDFQIQFGVREGPAVTNVRFTYREVICGKASVHRRNVVLSVDESGHFTGVVIPYRLELEGTFTAAQSAEGRIISLATTGLPGCTRKVVAFSAHPKS